MKLGVDSLHAVEGDESDSEAEKDVAHRKVKVNICSNFEVNLKTVQPAAST